MKLHFGFNFYAFAIFFSVALVEAWHNHAWFLAFVWLACALLFLYADTKKLEH